MPKYRVTSGSFRYDDERHEPGDTINLPSNVRNRFPAAMFEKVELDEPDDDAVPMSDADPEAPEASTDLPDDWHLLRSMAVVADGIAGDANGDEIRDHFDDYEPSEIAQIRGKAEERLED